MDKDKLEHELSKVLALLHETKKFKGGVRPADPVDEASELLKKNYCGFKKKKMI